MQDLEKELQRLDKPEPSERFCRDAKERLMHKITVYENETWFARILSKIGPIMPSERFIETARMRLVSRITAAKRPVLGWLAITKRVVASTLVMAIAVTSVLFFSGGKLPVNASEDTYLEILAGKATIKHADQLIWDVVTKQTELAEGDLIQLDKSDSAIVHFFDDSQIRLTGDSLLLLSRIDISPGYDRQGVIEAILNKGHAWVQTLNVKDGFALFTLVTPDAMISANDASFDVQTNLSEPTTIRTFRHGVNVSAMENESRRIVATGKLNSFQQIVLNNPKSYTNNTVDLASLAPITDLKDGDRNQEWVKTNLQQDRDHLAQLRERELENLKSTTGLLPGHMLYPLKRAVERLSMALSFNEQSQANAQIDMANQRLNESIVLIEQGDTEQAKSSLAEYQDLMRQIAEENKSDPTNFNQISNRIFAVQQKTLLAALPSDAQIGIVKDALDQTEEMMADTPAQKADIRLKNSLDDLVHIQDYITSGDLADAREALVKHENVSSTLTDDTAKFTDDEQKKAFYKNILEHQYEESRILGEITRSLIEVKADESLVQLAKDTDQSINDNIKHVAAVALPLMPDIVLAQAVVLPLDEKVHEFVRKINIYTTWTGQSNQIDRLLEKNPQYATDMEFLTKLRDKLDVRGKDIINARILRLQSMLAASKGKRIQIKIQRAKQLMEMRSGN